MGNWTKGPWRVFHAGCFPGIEARDQSVVVWGKADDNEGVRGGSDEEVQANANLISAAPELYEALRACLGHLTGGMDGDWDEIDPVATARVALAKARGEAP
jgi:hypothetical protein